MVLYLILFFNVCFCLSPKRGSIAVAIWNMITSLVALVCFAALSANAQEDVLVYEYNKEDETYKTFVSDTPTRMKTASGIFGAMFVINAMLLWAAIKEKPAILTAWMIGHLILEIGFLVFVLVKPPTYENRRAWNALWYFRFGIALCFLRPVYGYIKSLVDPNPPTIFVNTLESDGTITKGVASINRV